LYLDLTMVLLDDLPGDRQTKAGSALFGGVKRLENLFYMITWYTATVVNEDDLNMFRIELCRLYCEMSPVRHGSAGIKYQVDGHLAHLIAIQHNRRQGRGEIGCDCNSAHIGVVGGKINNLSQKLVQVGQFL
jgi:hypothetical protein